MTTLADKIAEMLGQPTRCACGAMGTWDPSRAVRGRAKVGSAVWAGCENRSHVAAIGAPVARKLYDHAAAKALRAAMEAHVYGMGGDVQTALAEVSADPASAAAAVGCSVAEAVDWSDRTTVDLDGRHINTVD